MEDIKKLISVNDIVRYEWHNREFIILQHSGQSFWTATMNSAMFIKNLLPDSPKLRNIFDRYINKSRVVLSYHEKMKKKLITNLKKHGKVVVDTSDLLVFELKKPFQDPEIRKMYSELKIVNEKLSDYFTPKNGNVDIFTDLRYLAKEIIVINRHLPTEQRGLLSNRMMDIVQKMVILYADFYTGKDNRSLLLKFYSLIRQLDLLLLTSTDCASVQSKTALRIGELLLSLIDKLKKYE